MNAPTAIAAAAGRGRLLPIKGDGFLLYECQQGTPEWLLCRAGVITASDFKKARHKINCLTPQQALFVGALRAGKDAKEAMAIAGYKAAPRAEVIDRAVAGEKVGEFSDTSKNYAFRKAVERIADVPLEGGFVTWQMKHGQKHEPAARAAHEDALLRSPKGGLADMMVLPAGFITTMDGVFGCSVDGLIGELGGAEYKCLSSPESLRKVIFDADLSEYIDQVQGCMWITGREWWHFGLYVPNLKTIGLEFQMTEVQRDDDYIDLLESDLLEFNGMVNDYEERLRTMGAKAVEEAKRAIEVMLESEVGDEAGMLMEAM